MGQLGIVGIELRLDLLEDPLFVFLLMTFTSSPYFWGPIGFLAMLACAFVIVSNVRKMGKAGLESITASVKGKRLKNIVGDAGKNLRRPFRKDDGS